jgi:hypothetical protein
MTEDEFRSDLIARLLAAQWHPDDAADAAQDVLQYQAVGMTPDAAAVEIIDVMASDT